VSSVSASAGRLDIRFAPAVLGIPASWLSATGGVPLARTKKEQELFDLLRARGLRKRVASSVANAAGKADGGRVPKQVRNVIGDLQALVGEVEDRVTGRASRRSAAAAKAARTRKRNAAKRSTAAKKGARTRAKSS
jgi:hypothetical protein